MAARAAAAPDVIEKLKASGATRIVAFLPSGDQKPIALPEVRNKWLRTRALLENLGGWVRLEGYDKSGALLCVIDNPDAEPAGELEDLSPDESAARQVSPLLNLMLRGQDVALSRHHALLKTVLDANAQLLKLVSDRLLAMEHRYQQQLDRNQQYAEALAEMARAGEGDEMSGLLEALPSIVRLGGLLKGKVETKPAAAP